MRPVELLFALLAIGYVAGQVLQERKRLSLLQEMSADAARTFHEKNRRKHDLLLGTLTLGFALVAAASVTYAVVLASARSG